ncbi:MAG: tetratricopeptide repeat protein [Syntrophorhabdus sp. PtaU1.Bin058]|nr:MAG: tetratricopeptide repeat protein [Syntrophorhabdus sp. PtaU1.Bin058]
MTVYRISYIVYRDSKENIQLQSLVSFHRYCFIWGIILFLFLVSAVPAPAGESTIVPPEEIVTDFDARLALARTLSYDDATLNDSVREYEILVGEQPRNAAVLTETSAVYARLRQYPKALEYLNRALALRPDDENINRSAGDVYLYSGNLPEAALYYRRAYRINPASEETQKKLGLVLSWDKKDDEALPLLSGLYKRHPDDKEVAIEMAHLYARRNDHGESIAILKRLLAQNPDDPELLVGIADAEAGLGHAKRCMELYKKALAAKTGDEKLLLQFADRMNLWGDFYRIERIYVDHLKKDPGDSSTALKLAKVYESAQQYERAEGAYRKLLLKDRKDIDALLGLAALKLREKDFEASAAYAGQVLSIDPKNPGALQVKGKALIFLKRFNESRETYTLLTGLKGNEVRGYLGIGNAFFREKDYGKAKEAFNKALESGKDDIEARFYAAGFDTLRENTFIERLREGERHNPARLTAWADLYSQYGYFGIAIQLLRDALNDDPEYLPAKIALAQTLGINLQYAQSIKTYEELEKDFPDSSKILIEHARVLGWSKKYNDSIALYKYIHSLNPDDPLPLKEMARVAMWGKMVNEAMDTYAALLKPSVDSMLLPEIKTIAEASGDKQLLTEYRQLRKVSEGGSIYQGYERLSKDPGKNDRIEPAMVDLLPVYRTQKAVALEREAKRLSWDKRFARSMPYYEELIGFDPENEEAYFDYAQVECALGLCDREKSTYDRLLNIDPLHNLAAIALERQQVRKDPSLEFNYSYWMEDGRGDLAQITRDRFDLDFDLPVLCRYHFNVALHQWFEKPAFNHRRYGATGFTFGFQGVFNEYMRGEASWTYKDYANDEMGIKDTGKAAVWFNLKEYAHIGGGYERTDELYNYFGLKHGLQADNWWLGLRSDVTGRLDLDGKARFIKYNDDNEGKHYYLAFGYAFTDHPKIFKVTMSGEYRDTQHESIYAYNGENLTDITHAYWTPKDYTGAALTFEWRHDYSKLFFCGNELRFYDIKVSFGTDSENNPSAKIEGEIHHEFSKHWTVGLKALWHSSPQWDANGLWAVLRYQF